MKTRVRRCRPSAWKHKDTAVARTSQAAFLKGTPCHYCSLETKQAGQHLKSCVVLFQAALADILIKDYGGNSSDACAVDLAEQDGQQPKYHRGQERASRSKAGQTDKARIQANASGERQNSRKDWPRKNQDEDRVEELTNVVRLLAKVVLRHKDEHSRLRVESGFLVYCDTGEHGVTSTLFKMAQAWKAKKEEGKVTVFLRVTLFLSKILQDKLGVSLPTRAS